MSEAQIRLVTVPARIPSGTNRCEGCEHLGADWCFFRWTGQASKRWTGGMRLPDCLALDTPQATPGEKT